MNDQNLPAVANQNLPGEAAQPDTMRLEFSQDEVSTLIAAIRHAESVDLKKTEAIRVDAPYRKFEKKGEKIVRMIAGYSWRNSEYNEGVQVPAVSLYDVEGKCFEVAMQTALVGRMIERKLPKGTMVEIEYMGKTRGKNKFDYDDFKISVLVPKSDDKK